MLARAALHDGDLDEARFLCRSAIELLEHTAAPHYVAEANQVLALVEQRSGDLEAALDALWNGLGAVDRRARGGQLSRMASRIDETSGRTASGRRARPRDRASAGALPPARGGHAPERARAPAHAIERLLRAEEQEPAAGARPSCTRHGAGADGVPGRARPARTDGRDGRPRAHRDGRRRCRRTLAAATDPHRRLMFELRPTSLQQEGLSGALRYLAEQAGEEAALQTSISVP